jgi:2-phosphosulfolactate phosphatase
MKADLSWGTDGVQAASQRGDLIVIVDVLRFSSTVTTAIANGFTIIPAANRDAAQRLAERTGGAISGKSGIARYSLSPLDYLNPKETGEVVLVSPNGAACASLIGARSTGFIGCFLNARALARTVRALAESDRRDVAVVAAGEVKEDGDGDSGQRRFAIEDYLGSGIVLSELRLGLTPEAEVCMRAYEACARDCSRLIEDSLSGRYLRERGLGYDISHCVQTSIYDAVPVVQEGTIVAL